MLALTACGMEGGPIPVGDEARPVINGSPTSDFPAAGALVGGTHNSLRCSATLIGCQTVITAAHCFGPDGNLTAVDFYLPNVGVIPSESVEVHPGYTRPNGIGLHDLAIVRLAEPAEGIPPVPLLDRVPATQRDAAFVGYGQVVPDLFDSNIKQVGVPNLGPCPDSGDDAMHLCWHGPSRVCYGDSGGPLFIDDGAGWQLAGVASDHQWTPEEGTCGGWSFYARVASDLDFVRHAAGDDLGRDCSIALELDHADVHTRDGALGEGDVDVLAFEVPPGTAELRVTSNSQISGAGPFGGRERGLLELSVEPIVAPETGGCRDDLNYFSGCAVASPASGAYRAQVVAPDGSEYFQLTVTVLPGAPIAEPDSYELSGYVEIDAVDGVLANDSAGIGGEPMARLVTGPAGQLELRADGSFRYLPPDGFVGPDSFEYELRESLYTSETATVEITVLPEAGCGCSSGPGRQASISIVLVIGAIALTRRRRRV